MLPLLVLAAISLQGGDRVPFAHATISEAVDGLATLGYDFVPTNETGTYGRMTHDGSTVTASLDVPPPAHKGDAPTPLRDIQILTELAFSREIPLDLRATNMEFPTVEKPTLFTPHLGKTVTARLVVRLRPDSTRDEVRAALDGFWREMNDYAHSRGESLVLLDRPEWSAFRFSDDQVLNVADETSLSRVTNAWGWMWRKGWGHSGGGWAFPIDVGGLEVTVGNGTPAGVPPGLGLSLSASVDLPASVDPQTWVRTEGPRVRWATVTPGYGHGVSVLETIDLRPRVTLGDLHRRIAAFASDVDALARTLHTSADRS